LGEPPSSNPKVNKECKFLERIDKRVNEGTNVFVRYSLLKYLPEGNIGTDADFMDGHTYQN